MKNNNKNYKVPSFATSSVADGKTSMLSRIQSIFEDDKKRKGIILVTIILVIAIIASSFIVFGKQDVKQLNNSLTVYTFGRHNVGDSGSYRTNNPYNVEDAVKAYQTKYPNVKVNLVQFDDGSSDAIQVYNKLTTEILAGKGPDVIIGGPEMAELKDINKLVRSGNFAPMDEFIKNDETFKSEDFYAPMLENGIYKGERYIMPLRFSFGLMLSGENAMKGMGLDIESCKRDYLGYIKEANKFVTANPENQEKLFTNKFHLKDQLVYMGVSGSNGISNKDNVEMKQLMELYKPMVEMTLGKIHTLGTDQYRIENYGALIRDRKALFITSRYNPLSVLNIFGVPSVQGADIPVIIPIRRTDGGIDATIDTFAGINNSSPNQQNAYNFIRLLMSSEGEFLFYDNGLSVNRKMAEAIIRSSYTSYNYYDTDSHIQISENSSQTTNEVISYINEIDNAFFLSPLDKEIYNQMEPFFTDKSSYDECIKTIQQKMSLYETE